MNCGGNDVARCCAVDGPEVTPYQLSKILLRLLYAESTASSELLRYLLSLQVFCRLLAQTGLIAILTGNRSKTGN